MEVHGSWGQWRYFGIVKDMGCCGGGEWRHEGDSRWLSGVAW